MERLFAAPRYAELARSLSATYTNADPFPHVVIDNFLPPDVANGVLGEFPDARGVEWFKHDNPRERKLSTSENDHFGDFTRELLHEFNSLDFIRFLEALTGIGKLLPDPHFEGGGLHQIVRGGHLNIHADFNLHPLYGLDRRINVLVYLNQDWRDEWQGHLELWDRSMSSLVKKVAPLFNRCVIFSTTDDAYHGHPEALTCPSEVTRKSLALYYYSNGRPESEAAGEHTTLFRRRPQDVAKPIAWVITKARYQLAGALRKLAHVAEPDRAGG